MNVDAFQNRILPYDDNTTLQKFRPRNAQFIHKHLEMHIMI